MDLNITFEQEGVIYINGSVHNRDLYEILYQKEESERTKCLNDIIQIGTASVKIGQANVVEYEIKREFSYMQNNLQENFDSIMSRHMEDHIDSIPDKLTDTIKGYMEDHIKTVPDKLTEIINNQFEENTEKLESKLETNKSELKSEISKKIKDIESLIDTLKKEDLNPYRPGSYLSIIKAGIERLEDRIDFKNARIDTTGKGKDFEQKIFNLLCDIARPHLDEVNNLTNIQGSIPRCNKGDFPIDVRFKNKILRFIVEAKSSKDTSKYISSIEDVESYLDESLKNRSIKDKNIEAVFAIMVFEDDIPNTLKGRPVIGINKMVCTSGELQTAYYKAREYCHTRYLDYLEGQQKISNIWKEKKEKMPVDVRGNIKKKIKDIIDTLESIKEIKTNLDDTRRKINDTTNTSIGYLDTSLTILYYGIRDKSMEIHRELESIEKQLGQELKDKQPKDIIQIPQQDIPQQESSNSQLEIGDKAKDVEMQEQEIQEDKIKVDQKINEEIATDQEITDQKIAEEIITDQEIDPRKNTKKGDVESLWL